ncbi:cytochrome ubiquinol oxidase subunit I [Chlamydiales bacterium]|nr:cytochrome ubiquinol oxidase subunit I [Chlamydiales bacterium]
MDVEVLARVQFAVTIMFHYIYPPLSIGLGLIMVIMEGMWLKTKDDQYHRMAKFWTKIFALTFAIGVATGIVMEFEFGTNWSSYSKYVGDVFGSALAAEGIFAFFLESGFLALLLFGWNRIGPKLHFFSTVMVSLGSHFSAVWIIIANSFMQTPAGYHIVEYNGHPRAEITDFWQLVFSPSSMDRLVHALFGTWLAGSFLVISISAYYLLKNRHMEFAKRSMKIGLVIASMTVIFQGISGDSSGKTVAKHQPMKLAALEGVFHTQKEAPLYVFGVVNKEEEKIDYGIAIPSLLSFLAYSDFDATVKGLNAFPKADWPKVQVLFTVYRMMILMWCLMFFVCFTACILWWKGTLFKTRWLLWIMVFSVLFPQIANQTGWISAEMGRYPWIVYDLLRISDGLSKVVTANQVLSSLIMFGTVYSFLFIVFIYLLTKKIMHGPVDDDTDSPFHSIEQVAKELKK